LTCRHGGALGRYQEIRGDEPGPLTISLERCGTAIGRLLDRNSQPVPELVLHCDGEDGIGMELGTRTDRDGRFRIDGLVPGQPYRLWHSQTRPQPYERIQVEPGKVKVLGDAHIELERPGTGA
jgi:hypothetical protein